VTSLRVTDMLGNEYGVGDHVVYATTSGKCPVLKYAVVDRIVPDERTRYRYDRDKLNEHGYPTRVAETYTYLKVGVRELSNGRGFRRWDRQGDWDDKTRTYGPPKPARVTYPMTENIVKAVGPGGAE
jgi:hypothetical protein